MFMKPNQEKEAIKKQQQKINKLLKKEENKLCADCKSVSPQWASINLGVFICIECSGCHRELGTHISKIKSINLDTWPKDILENFKKIDNQIANKYWEYNLHNYDFGSLKKNRNKLMSFIRDKYEHKKWANKNEIDPMTRITKESKINSNSQNNNSFKFNFNQSNENMNNFINFNNQNINNYNYNLSKFGNTYSNNNNNYYNQNMNNFSNNEQNMNNFFNNNNNLNNKNLQNNNNESNDNILSFYNVNYNNNINNIGNKNNLNIKENNSNNNQNSSLNFNWNFFN